jgi:hypothetical protein
MRHQGSVKNNLGAKDTSPTQAFAVVSSHALGVELGQIPEALHA